MQLETEEDKIFEALSQAFTLGAAYPRQNPFETVPQLQALADRLIKDLQILDKSVLKDD